MEAIQVLLFLGQLGAFALIAGVAGFIAWPGIKRWIEVRVDSQFAHQLETHKNDLLLITESARFDYSRKLVDLNLYSARRDAAAAHLYATLNELHNHLSDLATPLFEFPIEDFGKPESLSTIWMSWRQPLRQERKCLLIGSTTKKRR